MVSLEPLFNSEKGDTLIAIAEEPEGWEDYILWLSGPWVMHVTGCGPLGTGGKRDGGRSRRETLFAGEISCFLYVRFFPTAFVRLLVNNIFWGVFKYSHFQRSLNMGSEYVKYRTRGKESRRGLTKGYVVNSFIIIFWSGHYCFVIIVKFFS